MPRLPSPSLRHSLLLSPILHDTITTLVGTSPTDCPFPPQPPAALSLARARVQEFQGLRTTLQQQLEATANLASVEDDESEQTKE